MFIGVIYNPFVNRASTNRHREVGPYAVIQTDDPNLCLRRLTEGQKAISIVDRVTFLNMWMFNSVFEIIDDPVPSVFDQLAHELQDSYTAPGIMNITQRDELSSTARQECANVLDFSWSKEPAMFSLKLNVLQDHPAWTPLCSHSEYEPIGDNFVGKLVIDHECTSLFDSKKVSYRQLL